MKYKYNNEWKEMNVKVSDTLPIGSVVEYDGETIPSGWEEVEDTGSNENGNWIKYTNGVMICYKTHAITTSIATQWGSVYESPAQNLGSFPVNFIAKPNIQATVSLGGAFIESITDTSTNSWGNTILCRPVSTNASYTYKVDLLAIGRWK